MSINRNNYGSDEAFDGSDVRLKSTLTPGRGIVSISPGRFYKHAAGSGKPQSTAEAVARAHIELRKPSLGSFDPPAVLPEGLAKLVASGYTGSLESYHDDEPWVRRAMALDDGGYPGDETTCDDLPPDVIDDAERLPSGLIEEG